MTLVPGLFGPAAVVVALLQAAPSPRTVDRGVQSFVYSARQVTVRDGAEWEALWREHAPGRPLPAVDFAREMVVGVFLGSRPTGGYVVEIVSTGGEQGALVIRYRETRPAPDRITAQVLTFPYHLVAVPQQSGMVRFEKV